MICYHFCRTLRRSLRKSLAVLLFLFASGTAQCQNSVAPLQTPAPNAFNVNTVVPLTFPVLGKTSWSDTFNPGDAGRGRIHHGQDLMAKKMTPLVAAMDGVVFLNRAPGHNMLSLMGDNGYYCLYCHINDDTPGTSDHNGTEDYAYAPGLKSGDHVVAGQMVAWVGDSGNARGGPPHCHFELTQDGEYLNPAPSLRAARRLTKPVFALPQPQLRPEAGEIRLDGVVRSFDGGKTLVLRVLSCTTPGKPAVVLVKPTRRWVTLQPDTLLRHRDLPDQTLTAAEIKPGLPIIVFGKDRGVDKAVQARLAAAEPMPALQTAAINGGRSGSVGDNTIYSFSLSNAVPLGNNASQPGNNPRRSPVRPVVPARALTASETDLVEQVNKFRRENNLPPFTLETHLSDVAWKHSLDMATAGFYGHVGSDGSLLAVRLNLAGVVYTDAAENLAVNIPGEEGVMTAWLAPDSKSRRHLLNPAFTSIGVAHVQMSAGDNRPRRVEHAWTLILTAP